MNELSFGWLTGPRVFRAPDDGAAAPGDGSGVPQGEPEAAGSEGGAGTQGKGASVPGWMGQLPDDLKADPELAKYPTIGDYVKASRAKADGKKADVAAPVPVEYDEGFSAKIDESDDPFGDKTQWLKDQLSRRGVAQKDAEQIIGEYGKVCRQSYDRMFKEGQAWRDARLAQQWGDKAKQNTRYAQRALRLAVGGDKALQEAMDRTAVTINPVVWEVMARLGSRLSDDTAAYSGETGTGQGPVNPFAPIKFPR